MSSGVYSPGVNCNNLTLSSVVEVVELHWSLSCVWEGAAKPADTVSREAALGPTIP